MKFQKFSCVLFLGLFVGMICCQAQNKAFEIDALMLALKKAKKFNGSILVAQKGNLLLHKGYGNRNFRDGLACDSSSIYQIASVTKPFTAVLALKLAEQKKLSLEDKIEKYYDDFPKASTVTISHLLNHTSGISDHQPDSSEARYDSEEKTFIELLKKRPFDFDPGTSWKYSNSGYILLGYIIEKVSGLTYYDAIIQYVFKPLKMNQSGFDFTALKDKRKAVGYWTFPDHKTDEPAKLIHYSAPAAAGAIYSTTGDLYKFHVGLQSEKLVRASVLENAYTPVIGNYGYGWFVDYFNGRRLVHHSGDIWGFKSEFARVPEDDICIVMLSNIEDEELHGITIKILSILYGLPYQMPAENKVALTQEELKEYEGKYELRPNEFIALTVKNDILQGNGQVLYAQKKDLFMLDNGREQRELTFERNSAGKILGFKFRNGEIETFCKKN
ncbi:beta-lactamase [Flavobacterium sp. F52]|nr:beta-lactamase [Flavobacterium sp. F52]